jgi:pimeloyl-ACP methyl ester carboxylesterase
MRGRFETADGIGLAWEDEGEGIPLLCLPGLTRNARDFDDLAAVRGDRYRLVRLTLRGRGESGRDPDWRNYTVAVEAQDVLAFLDARGLARVVVVGTSRGGLIAMLLAAMAPERLAGVLLNDVGPVLEPAGLARIMSYLGIAPKARSMDDLALALRATMGEAFPDLPPERWQALARRWFDEGPDGAPRLSYDPRLRDAVEAASAQPAADMWPLFEAMAGIPVGVVRGANSDLLSRETVAAMRARRPDLVAAEVPDRGHVPFLDEAEAVAALDELVARAVAPPA